MDPSPSDSSHSPLRTGSAKPAGHYALVGTAVAAVGVVFGDIGTSPLYTLQVAVESQGGPLDARDTFGVVSLILWALILAVSVKYVSFVMRADNDGEGGILALLALLPKRKGRAHRDGMALLVIAGAALLFGDGMITPAISVLSALEGLDIAAPAMKPHVLWMTCGVLLGLFAIQRRGTGSVGLVFGPIMLVWFVCIGALGARSVLRAPEILGALSPLHGAMYFGRHGLRGLSILGVVVLAITGGEALYADMGHFGAKPIRLSWFALVLPALGLAYLGQGALILRHEGGANPFFAMVPKGPAMIALVVLAALATTIASQALISGVFSLTHQAVGLGYFPRVTVKHTSREAEGQIYVPLMNWLLMVACIALVLGFRESSRLASAYGIAVSGTMAITSIVFAEVTRKTWHWPRLRSAAVLAFFLAFDIPFFAANLFKFVDGGYIPILVGVLFFVVMLDWHTGRALLRERLEARSASIPDFVSVLKTRPVARVPGMAIYLSSTGGVPLALRLQADRVRSVAERVLLLRVVIEHSPQVDAERRCEVEPSEEGIATVTLRFGYMERPSVPEVLAESLCKSPLQVSGEDLAQATYYVSRETFLAGKGGKMGSAAESLFALLARNANGAADHFGLPDSQVIELGTRIDL